MLYDTLYDIAGDPSCFWRCFDFLVGSLLLSEISPLAPRIGGAENLKQENLKSGFFSCYQVSRAHGIYHSVQQNV